MDSGQRVNLALKQEIHLKAKAMAAIRETSLNEFFREAIEAAVTEDRKLFEEIK
jgi:predicted HicB family RNase H-like nuclease